MNGRLLSRRRMLQASSAVCGTALAGPCGGLLDRSVRAQAPAAEAKPAVLNRFPRMVHDFYRNEVSARGSHAIDRKVEQELFQGGKEKAATYVADAQARIDRCFGPWPERAPLNPTITGVVEREAYRIEKVIFESRPQFYVTANLYVPKGLKEKAPGVIGSCGHSSNGKAAETYQSFAQGLARLGYVCLIFDPIGQGERLQLPDEHLKPRIGVGVGEHLMVGNQQFLVGEFFGSWRAWDGIRALDYLLSRDEVDPKHVGITGNSGGGTMTTWLCGVERRWTMAATSCFVTTFQRNFDNELPADTEQCPPRAMAELLDHADFLAAMAPKPMVIIGQEKDFFDVRGTTEAFDRLQRLYAEFGAEENLRLHIGPNPHGYAQDGREAMYACFNRATGRGDKPVTEPEIKFEDDATLQCTKHGQVAEMKSRTVYSFTKETAERLAKDRRNLRGHELRVAIIELAGANITPSLHDMGVRPFEHPISQFDYRILRPRAGKGYPLSHFTTYLIGHDSPVFVPVYRLYDAPHYSRPPRDEGPAILYVSHDSCDAELREEPLLREIIAAEKGAAIYACDVRGIGESKPNTCGENSYATAYGCDYFYAAHAIMLDRPYIGGRTYDVLAAISFIREAGHKEVHLVARGYGALPAAFAAVISDGVTQVTLKHALTSYQELASADIYAWPLSSMVPGVLKQFDLPDVYDELTRHKRLRMVEPRGAGMTND